MQNENEVKAGSVVINPLQVDEPNVDQQQIAQPPVDGNQDAASQGGANTSDGKQPGSDDQPNKIEEALKASQQMIGRQSQEIGALRAKLEEIAAAKTPQQPAGPTESEQLDELYRKMDIGEIDIAEGMRQALEINSKLTAAQVMSKLQEQRQQEEVTKIHKGFLEKNPDYEQVVQSGALQPYLDADPMADVYTAYQLFKADERVKQLEADYQQKILAAKEEGAKLAKGAEAAGKVIGKQGATALQPQVNRPFKNTQEATAAMMETLQKMRQASAT